MENQKTSSDIPATKQATDINTGNKTLIEFRSGDNSVITIRNLTKEALNLLLNSLGNYSKKTAR